MSRCFAAALFCIATMAGGCARRSVTAAANVEAVPFRTVVIDKADSGERTYHGDLKGIGDIDGDGLADVIFGGNDLAWYRYPSWEKSIIAIADQEFTTDMQTGDIDADGDLDLIVPDGPKGKIQWFENPRPNADVRRLWKSHVIGYQGDWAHDVEVADINGDGRLDVVTRKEETFLWVQNSPDSFRRIPVKAARPNGEGTALGDINKDGRIDIVQNGYWLEAPADPASEWVKHWIDRSLPAQLSVALADLNADDRLDVLFVPAESGGCLRWYEAPSNPSRDRWIEHVIDEDVDHVHSLRTGDFNNDGRLDVAAAEMQQSASRRVLVYLSGGENRWKRQVLSTTGSHNLRIGDIGGDGDLDIVGANWGGSHHPLELWENLLIAERPSASGWRYEQVDDARAKWGVFGGPSYARYLGLAFGDFNSDGHTDIVSGRYFYRNPGLNGGKWARSDLGANVDAMLTVDVDDDGSLDVIAEALPDVYWLKPMDREVSGWRAMRVGSIPPTEHVNSQGYMLAQLVPGGLPEIVLTGGSGIYFFTIPGKPEAGAWPRKTIAVGTSEEGIGAADIDGDGHIDIAAGSKDGHTLSWWKNPGNGEGEWSKFGIGTTPEWADRIAIADINGDRRPDLVVAEETAYGGASVYWFESPADPKAGNWTRHTITTQFSTNAMDVADLDGDGDIDIVTGEHRGTRKLTIWVNAENGRKWAQCVVDAGKENHLGARVADFGNGRLGIAGIAWDTYPLLHVWQLENQRAMCPGVAARRGRTHRASISTAKER